MDIVVLYVTIGDFFEDKMQGKGIYVLSEGATYNGEMYDNRPLS